MNVPRRRYLLSLLLLLLPLTRGEAQEFNCRVEVNAAQLQGSDKELFETLAQAITEYINNREWSDAQFSTNERIECSMAITLKENPEEGRYKGEIQVQSRRPVYNATYNSTLLNFRDTNLEFSYSEYDPLVYTENTIENNLTAIINFYVYMILGLDFDSFAPLGGDPYYQRALNVANLAQTQAETGWKAFDDSRNRYALVTAFTEPRMADFRRMWYSYHREGLDAMALSMDKGRGVITKQLETLNTLKELDPMSILFPLFGDSKIDELGSIYSKAPAHEKKSVYDNLINIYPTEGTRLNKIKEEQR